ncbi:MAG: MoaD/ThiS family protein [Ignavibacteria bacterium]|nr:MoaD/ThiS family protein [Ignavibacteria bacterium]
MTVKVMIPTPLRSYTEKKDSVIVEGSNVNEVLRQLTLRYSELNKHLYDDSGSLRNFVNIYVNDEDIRYLQKGQTTLTEKDVVSIIPSIAGGRE